MNFIFENINNRLKKIIMVRNRKSVVNDDKVETVQPSWFTVPFVRGITEKFSRLNSERMIVLHIVLINCENSLGSIRTLYTV